MVKLNKKNILIGGVILIIVILVILITYLLIKHVSKDRKQGDKHKDGDLPLNPPVQPGSNNVYFVSGPYHRTDKYRLPKEKFVVRRGFPFYMKTNDKFQNLHNVEIKTTNHKHESKNDIKISGQALAKDTIRLTVVGGVQAPIGSTQLILTDKKTGERSEFTVYVVFNPWHPE